MFRSRRQMFRSLPPGVAGREDRSKQHTRGGQHGQGIADTLAATRDERPLRDAARASPDTRQSLWQLTTQRQLAFVGAPSRRLPCA